MENKNNYKRGDLVFYKNSTYTFIYSYTTLTNEEMLMCEFLTKKDETKFRAIPRNHEQIETHKPYKKQRIKAHQVDIYELLGGMK